jgi:septal ring factor EnvC (AmiA/AmiB activator)
MRRKSYLESMLREDRRLLGALSEESGRLKGVQTELAVKRKELDQERKNLVHVKEAIRLEREKKKAILAGLRIEKDARARALKELEQAALRLQRMMDEIARKAGPSLGAPGSGFERLKGNLDYPTRGKVVAGFGRASHPEFTSEMFRKGIEIEAPYGEEIRAVESGKVIFADRFSGYGRMMIIDHGQRYYTIYAHLADLLKEKGDPVQRGEPVALVGDSDSLAGARLYFEIRKDGRPMDPLPWFKKQ